MPPTLRLPIALLLLITASPFLSQSPATRIILTSASPTYFLGENVLINYCFENVSAPPVTITFGGDYRGASRSQNFKVTVTDSSGTTIPDPDPSGASMGGLGNTFPIEIGRRWCQSLPLMRYVRIDEPGEYDIRVLHNLGFPAGQAPEGRMKIRLTMPTEAQAEAIVAATLALPQDSGIHMGMLSEAFADYSAMRYGVYLAPLLRRAEAGNAKLAVG